MVIIKKGNRTAGKIEAGRLVPFTQELKELIQKIPPKIKIVLTRGEVIFTEVPHTLRDVYHLIYYLPTIFRVKEVQRFSALPTLKGVWVTLKNGKRIFIRTEWKPAGSSLIHKKFTLGINAPQASASELLRLKKAQSKASLFLSTLPEKHIKEAELNRLLLTTPSELLKTLKAKKVAGNFIGTYNVKKKLIILTPRPTKELKNLTNLHIGYSLSFKVPKDPKFREDFIKLFGEESRLSRELFASGYATYANSTKTRRALKALQPELYAFYKRLFLEW